MEFAEVVRRRRMVRSFSDRPVEPQVVDRMLAHAVRAPSAGNTQGWAFLVLAEPEEVSQFWDATASVAGTESSWLRGMRTAPLLIVPLSSERAYLDRYAEPDKGWSDRDPARWPVPYWHLDTAMAALLILLTAVDERLGACFFGIPPERTEAFRASFGVPESHTPIGAIAVGHRAESTGPRGSADRGRRTDVVHRGRWKG